MGARIIKTYDKRGDQVTVRTGGRFTVLALEAGDTLTVYGDLPGNIEDLSLCTIEVLYNRRVLTFAEGVVMVVDGIFSNFFCARHVVAMRKDRFVADDLGEGGPRLDTAPRCVSSTRALSTRLTSKSSAEALITALHVRGLLHASLLVYPDELLVTQSDGRTGWIVREVLVEDLLIDEGVTPRREDRWLHPDIAA